MACSQIVSAQPSMVSVELVVWIPFEFLAACRLKVTPRDSGNASIHSAKH